MVIILDAFLVIDAMPDAKILMMPQTVFFQHEENAFRFSENHNKASRMLFWLVI